MNCPKCGSQLAPNMKFCAKCGTAVAPAGATRPKEIVSSQPIQQKKPSVQAATPAQATPATQQNNVPDKKKKDKPTGKKKNLGLKITAIILAIAVFLTGGIFIFDRILYKNSLKGAEYIKDFPVLKQKTELTVYDSEKFPAEEYNIKVERMGAGGILKSGKIFKSETIVDEDSTSPTFNIDFEKDGNYIITLTDITSSRTQTTVTSTKPENDEKKEKDDEDQKVIIIEVKVDDNDKNAAERVDLNKNTDDKVPTHTNNPSTDASGEETSFIEATDEDFEELERLLNRNNFQYGKDFDCNTATTQEIVEESITSFLGIDGYIYFFEDVNEENYFETYQKYCENTADPKGKFGYDNGGYMIYQYCKLPQENIEWVCENVFNVSFDSDYESDKSYFHDNYCYVFQGNAGDGGYYFCEVTDSKVSDDGKYEVIVENRSMGFDEAVSTLESTKKVTAEIKIIDGERYWSIYKIEDYDPSADITETQKPSGVDNVKRGTKKTIAAGLYHTVAVKNDGTVVASGDNDKGQCDVSGWSNIVAVSAGEKHTVGLRADGTVVAVGENTNQRCDVSGWTDIVAISAGSRHTIGLKSDGTVVAAGNDGDSGNVSGWTDIIDIAAGSSKTIGLKSDGTVVVAGDCYDLSTWTDIVDIATGERNTIGLKSDGTVVVAGDNSQNQYDASSWSNIVAVDTAGKNVAGLTADGRVLEMGYSQSLHYSRAWKDVVAISFSNYHAVALKADGTTVATGGVNTYGDTSEIDAWTNIKLPE